MASSLWALWHKKDLKVLCQWKMVKSLFGFIHKNTLNFDGFWKALSKLPELPHGCTLVLEFTWLFVSLFDCLKLTPLWDYVQMFVELCWFHELPKHGGIIWIIIPLHTPINIFSKLSCPLLKWTLQGKLTIRSNGHLFSKWKAWYTFYLETKHFSCCNNLPISLPYHGNFSGEISSTINNGRNILIPLYLNVLVYAKSLHPKTWEYYFIYFFFPLFIKFKPVE